MLFTRDASLLCPGDEEFSAFVEDGLSAEARARFEEHASACRPCRLLVSELVGGGHQDASFASADTVHATSFVDVALRRATSDLRIGTTLGDKWLIERLVGAGGSSLVYEGRHRNGRRVAIKILRPELISEPAPRRRFLREGLLANRIAHPGVVAVLDDGTAEDGTPYLVMELLEGETLRTRLERDGEFSEDDVLRVAEELLDVLAVAHADGLIHRDIKPENVFITESGALKILDFGSARIDAVANDATAPGVMMGTPAFMSPEQARGRWDVVDARSDVWSVGATMFALLVGRSPRDGATPNEQLLQAMTERVPSIATVSDVSKATAQIVGRALSVERDRRYANAAEMRDAVREARLHVGTRLPHSKRSHWRIALPAGALASAAVVVFSLRAAPPVRVSHPQPSSSPAVEAAPVTTPIIVTVPTTSAPIPPAPRARAAPVLRLQRPATTPSAETPARETQPVADSPPARDAMDRRL